MVKTESTICRNHFKTHSQMLCKCAVHQEEQQLARVQDADDDDDLDDWVIKHDLSFYTDLLC